MNTRTLFIGFTLPFLLLASCDRTTIDAPPSVQIGNDVCDECNMIISDERFATATIVRGDRGPEPLLFDDFNCQVNHELSNQDLDILERWSHTYDGVEWIRTKDAVFLLSNDLRTPMASHAAAFSDEGNAEDEAKTHPGDVVAFDIAWARLALNGGSCGSHNSTRNEELSGDHDDDHDHSDHNTP